jgi:predicted MFS family arabinose efflux permease
VQGRHERRVVLRTLPVEDRSHLVLRAGAANGSPDQPLLRLIMGSAPSVHAIGAAQLIAWGVTFYAIPPLLPRVSAALDVSMSALSVAMTVGLVLNAFASLVVARWIHHKGARAPMVAGSILASVALVVLATSQTKVSALIAVAVLGAVHAALLYEPAFAAVSTQTSDPIARTRAIQVITFWGGWAALWALPTASLLGSWIGWRWTLVALAGLLAAHTIRVHASLPPPLVARRQADATRPPPISVALAAAFALGAFATTAIVVNGLLLLGDRSISITSASIVFASLAPFQVVGRFWFMRRRGRLARHDGSLPFVLVGTGLLALLAAPHFMSLAIFVVVFGAGAGLLTTVRAAVVVARLAPEHAAMQLGAYSFVGSIARALAPAGSGWIYFSVGYELALLTFAAMALVAAALVWRATARYSLVATPSAGFSAPCVRFSFSSLYRVFRTSTLSRRSRVNRNNSSITSITRSR